MDAGLATDIAQEGPPSETPDTVLPSTPATPCTGNVNVASDQLTATAAVSPFSRTDTPVDSPTRKSSRAKRKPARYVDLA